MSHFTNAEKAYTGLQNESASTHLERSVCRDALVVLVDSQCLPVYLTLASDRTSNLSSVTRGSRDFRCESTGAEITLPTLVPKSAQAHSNLATDGKRAITDGKRAITSERNLPPVIITNSKDNPPSLFNSYRPVTHKND